MLKLKVPNGTFSFFDWYQTGVAAATGTSKSGIISNQKGETTPPLFPQASLFWIA